MKPPSRTFILFNAAAAVIVLGSAVAVVRSWVPEEIAACGERYRNGVVFALERAPGQLVSSADLQSRLGVDEWGVLDNVAAISVADAPAKSALKVKFNKASNRAADGAVERYGMGFAWKPRAFQASTSACLTYSIKVPEGFVFGRGGQLPGLGAPQQEGARDPAGTSSLLQWRENGVGEVVALLGKDGDRQPTLLAREAFKLKTGQWTTLEHEVVLNTPGSADGIVRLWVDGRLKLERKGLVLRGGPDQTLGGVNAQVQYGIGQGGMTPPAGQELMVTPFELRWP